MARDVREGAGTGGAGAAERGRQLVASRAPSLITESARHLFRRTLGFEFCEITSSADSLNCVICLKWPSRWIDRHGKRIGPAELHIYADLSLLEDIIASSDPEPMIRSIPECAAFLIERKMLLGY